MRAARRDPRRGEKPMTAFKPRPVFACCLWAHPAPAPGSSVEQGQIEIIDEGQAFSGLGDSLEGNAFMIETTAAGQGNRADRCCPGCAGTAAVLVS